jgi:DHA2 family multidrug resistance protein-like MFS transporter
LAPELARGLAGAVTAAERLPADLAADLIEAARESFTNGLNVVAGVSAAAAVVFAILAGTVLRHVSRGAETEQAATAAGEVEQPGAS